MLYLQHIKTKKNNTQQIIMQAHKIIKKKLKMFQLNKKKYEYIHNISGLQNK